MEVSEKRPRTETRGRPEKRAVRGRRASLGLKVTPAIKRQLSRATTMSGRTQSQEAEHRLELSFYKESLFPEIFDFGWGRKTTALAVLVGRAIEMSGRFAKLLSLGERGFSGDLDPAELDWTKDPFAYDQVVKAINSVLEAYRPIGDPNQLATGEPASSPHTEVGERSAEINVLRLIAEQRFAYFEHGKMIAERLGPVDAEMIERARRAIHDGTKSNAR